MRRRGFESNTPHATRYATRYTPRYARFNADQIDYVTCLYKKAQDENVKLQHLRVSVYILHNPTWNMVVLGMFSDFSPTACVHSGSMLTFWVSADLVNLCGALCQRKLPKKSSLETAANILSNQAKSKHWQLYIKLSVNVSSTHLHAILSFTAECRPCCVPAAQAPCIATAGANVTKERG